MTGYFLYHSLFLSLSFSLSPSSQINGELTQGENIADNGGVKTAFQAYKDVLGTDTPPSLPAIDLNPDQLFFVAFSQVREY